MFIVDTSYDYAEFNTYREAEIYCGENGISCENIYEEIWKSRKAFSFFTRAEHLFTVRVEATPNFSELKR